MNLHDWCCQGIESNKTSMETPADIENYTYGSQLIAQEPPSNQQVTQRYNLRWEENLNVLAKYLDDQKHKNDKAIGKLKRKRAGKKSIITMKINQINIFEEHWRTWQLEVAGNSKWSNRFTWTAVGRIGSRCSFIQWLDCRSHNNSWLMQLWS